MLALRHHHVAQRAAGDEGVEGIAGHQHQARRRVGDVDAGAVAVHDEALRHAIEMARAGTVFELEPVAGAQIF